MKKINSHLLATRSILAFHIAAREQSFTRAAEVLNIGQSAISHGVRQLEDRLGVTLFERHHQRVSLTLAGEKLARRLQRGFGEIEAGLEEVKASQATAQRVTILVSTSLASHWLMPRIVRFKQTYPKVQLRCITQDTDQDIHQSEFDLCIPLGQVPWQGYKRWKLVDEALFPVCSPAYMQQYGSINKPEDLVGHALIHLEERHTPRFDWAQYLRRFDQSVEESTSDVTFNDYSIVVQAAMEGQGIALGWKHIVQPLIDQGRLVGFADMTIRTDHPFYILAPENKEMNEASAALLEWLLAEMQGTTLNH